MQDTKTALNKLTGIWRTEGLLRTPEGALTIKISGTDTYKWILDGPFLLHKAEVLIGKDKSETHEIIGFDKSRQK